MQTNTTKQFFSSNGTSRLLGVIPGFFLLFAACSIVAAEPAGSGQAGLKRPLFPFCFELGEGKNQSMMEQVAMVKKLGFDGVGYPLWLDDNLDRNLKILDDAGLKVCMLYTSINVNPAVAEAYHPKLKDAMARLKGRQTTICVMLQGLPPADAKGEETAVRILRELAAVASDAGLRISIYHHTTDWTESPLFALKVVKKVDHPAVGANFNMCHWLMVEGDKDYQPVLLCGADKIFMVTISGAKLGSKTWTDGLILPLDDGDFDNGRLLKVLREMNYRGPIGLQCYGIPGDAGEYLAHSMEAWKKLKANLEQ